MWSHLMGESKTNMVTIACSSDDSLILQTREDTGSWVLSAKGGGAF